MADKTGIEWTDATWNPVTGCTKISPGCDHCYAERIAERFGGTKAYPNGFDVTLHHHRLSQPLSWRKPRMIFVNSMSDLFHKDIPYSFTHKVFDVMEKCPQHTFQILTKRSSRMRQFINERYNGWCGYANSAPENVWLGVSVESPAYLYRIDHLREARCKVRFVSFEPLLEYIDEVDCLGLSWFIVGGESGPGARPMHPRWAQRLRDIAKDKGVKFHFKQWGSWVTEKQSPEDITLPGSFSCPWEKYDDEKGEYVGDPLGVFLVGKKAAGRLLDGREWNEMPGDARA